MRPQLVALIAIVWVVTFVAHFPAAAQTSQPLGPQPFIYKSSEPLDPPQPINPKAPVTVMLELAGPPAINAGNSAAIQSQSASNERQQAGLLRRPNMSGVRVLFQSRLAYNGIAVVVPYERLPQLQRLPEVIGVHLISPKQRSSTSISAAQIATLWSYGGATGKNVRIGIIDTGIDYTHATFGGTGTSAAYNNNNRNIIEPGSFPTAKVVGGHDFAGDNYNASGSSGSPIPTPDPDPLDCNGHGTHIASTTAGFGVTSAGQTYQGPYSDSLNPSNFQVVPGVAPEASLYAYKVFGCNGTTALLIAAIERALDPNGDGNPADHLDVLAVAMSAPFGSDNDPDSVAANNAVRNGVVVVAAAGDNNNTFYVLSSPSSARLAIAVGATNESSNTAGSTAGLAPFSSRGPQRGHGGLKPDMVAPGVAVNAADMASGASATALSGTSIATASVAGAAALLRELHPGWTPLQIKAALVGGATPVPYNSGTYNPPSLAGGGRLNLADLPNRTLLAFEGSPESPVGLTFGAPWLAQTTVTLTRALVLENTEGATRTVTLSSNTVVAENGVTLSLPTQPLIIPDRSQVTVPVTLTIQPGALDFTPDPTLQGAGGRHYLAEHGGYIEASSPNAQLRMVHAANRATVAVYLDEEPLAQQLDSSQATGYSTVPAGTHTVRVVSVDPPQSTPLLTSEVELPAEGSYSLMLIGQEQQLDVLPVNDSAARAAVGAPGRGADLSNPANVNTTTASIRFVNSNLEGSQGPGALDVYVDEKLVLSGLAPGATSTTSPIPSGTHAVAFVKSGQPISSTTLEAWQVLVAAPGEQLLVGAGQYDEQHPHSTAEAVEIIQQAIANGEIDPARCTGICPRVWADFQNGTGWISDSWRRGVTASAMRMSAPEEVTLRLPFNILPKAASNASAASASLTIPSGATTFSLGLNNTGVRNGGAQFPLVGAFELTGTSPRQTVSSSADLRFLGVTSNLTGTSTPAVANATIYFGIATHQPWSTPNEVQFRLYIDTDRNGTDDYLIVNSNLGTGPNDAFINVTYPITTNGKLLPSNSYSGWNTFAPPSSPIALDGAPFNSGVTILSTVGSLIGLDSTRTTFRYRLETYARDSNNFQQLIDTIPASGQLTYNIAQTALQPLNNPASSIGQRPIFRDQQGGQITGRVNTAILATRPNQRLLLLHLHNPPGSQAELVSVSTP